MIENGIKHRIKMLAHSFFQKFSPPDRHLLGVVSEYAASIGPKYQMFCFLFCKDPQGQFHSTAHNFFGLLCIFSF